MVEGYEMAMEAAGATVLEYKAFGSYQGDWWALVKYNGRVGWVNGSYGSCSGCDAFQAEFGLAASHYHEKDGNRYGEYIYDTTSENFDPVNCSKCHTLGAALAEFGQGYLDSLMTQEEAEADARENLSWDMEAKDMVAWLRKIGNRYGRVFNGLHVKLAG